MKDNKQLTKPKLIYRNFSCKPSKRDLLFEEFLHNLFSG